MACNPAHHRARICPPQGRLPRRSVPAIWLVTLSLTIPLHLWPELHCGHALICSGSRGGYPSIRHNELRDITAGFLSEVCHNVGTEPPLQPITGEQLTLRSANTEDGARLDVAADDFWGRDRSRAYFDVRVFFLFAQSHQ